MAVTSRYVCLLRAINLGGRNRVTMADLRETCASVGCEDVRTYIASGNLVCTSSLSAGALRHSMEIALERDFGFPVKVVVLTANELSKMIDQRPFKSAEPRSLHMAMATEPIDRKTAAALAGLEFPGEQLAVKGRAIYYQLPSGYGPAQLPKAVDRLLKVPTTVRTWRTILVLREMAIATQARQ